MNFKLNSEQQLLQDSVRRFIDKTYAFEARTTLLKNGNFTKQWDTLATNGWLAAALPDDCGGLGGSILDTTLIAHEFGRGLVVEPYLGCAVLAAQTLAAAANAKQKKTLLPAIAEGSRRLALAYSEPFARSNPAFVRLCAEQRGDSYVLTGRKTLVLGAVGADSFLVSARIADESGDAAGISLFLVDAGSPGVTQHILPLHDGTEAAELVFGGVQVPRSALVGEAGQGMAALEHGLSHATAALCAELVGVAEKAIELTADYLKIRKQFGVPIASFQALQHRMADMAAELELSRSMLYVLLYSMENDEAPARQQTLSQAKALIGRMARSVCGQAIQLHGGIGMTEECAVGHYFKRAIVADALFGNSDQHDQALAAAVQAALSQSAEMV